MTDHAALVAEAREMVALWERERGMGWRNDWLMHVVRLADALEAVQQAPAVDREALAAVIHERFNIARGRGGVAPLALADQILAAGILLDAAEVEARGLESWIDEWPTTPGDGTFLADVARAGRARAQRVREGN